MNTVLLSGPLDTDARVHHHEGTPFARLQIGTLSTFQDPDGGLHQRLDTHRVTLFGALVERVQGLKAGDWITVRGALRTCELESEGVRFLSVEIVASGVEIRTRPTFSPRPAHSAATRLSRRTLRPRSAASHRRGRPDRGAHAIHPVDDGFLFDELIEGFLQSGLEDTP